MRQSAGTLIRDARRRARLSQSDLARRAGVAQSVISAYESGRREPGLPTLGRLIEATGHDVAIDILPRRGTPQGLPDGPLGRRLRHKRRAVGEVAARHGARNVRVFGSVARGDDTVTSDIDLLVDLDEGVGLVGLAALRRELGEALGAEVDVVPSEALKSRIRDRVLAEAVPL